MLTPAHPSGRRSRGAALLSVVLVAVAAATLAMVLGRQVTLSLRASAYERAAVDGRAAARALIDTAMARIGDDITLPFREVLPGEQARSCLYGPAAGTTIGPGAPWPSACGVVWQYPSQPLGTTPVLRVRAHSAEAEVILEAAQRSGPVVAGARQTLRPAGAGRYALAADEDLHLGGLAPSVALPAGIVYSSSQVLLPRAGESVSATGTIFAAEVGISGTTGAGAGQRFLSGRPSTDPLVEDLRAVVPHVNDRQSLLGSITALARIACPRASADTVPDPPGILPVAATFPTVRASHLCIAPGASILVDTNNDTILEYITLPVTAASVLVTNSTRGHAVDLYTHNTRVLGCLRTCSPYAVSAADVTANNHPALAGGAGAFWQYLGTAPLPVSGVVGTLGVQTVLGACGSAFMTPAATCPALRVHDGSGGTVPVTVLAGEPLGPQQVLVGAPLTAVAAVSSGDLAIAPWSASIGGNVALTAPAVVAGQFKTLPEDRPVAARSGAVQMTGGLIASRIVPLRGHTSLTFVGTPVVPRWLIGPRAALAAPPAKAATVSQICGSANSCTAWPAWTLP
jgi:hypothetical protein